MSEISMVFSCSNYYVPYLATCLSSLSSHISEENKYDITVLETNITEENKALLSDTIQHEFCNITYFPISGYIKEKNFFAHDHVSIETFYKLFIPKIFKKGKTLFCDSDIIFQADPAKLFNINIKDKYIAAGLCHHWNGLMNFSKEMHLYTTDKLKIKDESNYFQGGILLFNNNAFNEQDIQDILNIATQRSYLNHDQDVLNMWFQNKVHIFNSRWNYETSQSGFRKYAIPFMDKTHKKLWQEAQKKPAIIHYSGKEKPWFYPEEEFADIWWKYARKTPFYEEILRRLLIFSTEQDAKKMLEMRNILISNQNKEVAKLRNEFEKIHFPNINQRFTNNEYFIKLLFVTKHLWYFRLKKWRYGIKEKFSFGEKQQKYRDKYSMLKKLIKDALEAKRSL